RKPVSHLLIVLAAAENDATDPIAAGHPGRRYNLLAIVAPIETLNLPQIRFDTGVLELVDGFDHQARPHLAIIDLLIALELVEPRLLRRHKELEHEPTEVLVGEIIGQTLQSSRLFFVQRAIALRIVAHQDLAEGRLENFNMAPEILAIFEIELLLSTL